MTGTLLETFRTLSSFAPKRGSLAGAPWDAYVDWAIAQGLGPLAAYNLEYRLGGAEAPEWVRDRLLSVYQGSLNDNVMKLVNFKRTIDELEGSKVLLLGGASFAESLYPHVAFRPVADIQLLARSGDLQRVLELLGRSGFRPDLGVDPVPGATAVVSDGRTAIVIFTDYLGERRRAQEEAVFERALEMKVYGPSVFRPNHADAILLLCLEQARSGYQVPMISFVDLRELLLGAPSLGGPYSTPVDFEVLMNRALEWKLDRALFASTSIVERLFLIATPSSPRARPRLRASTQRLLEKWVVAPVAELGAKRVLKGADRWRRLLAGGG